MNIELTTVIMESLNDLIDEEECALAAVIKLGAASFEDRTFDKVELYLKEATLHKRALDICGMLRSQWKEFADLSECLRDWLSENEDPMEADLTVAYCTPDRRLCVTTDMLMKVLLKAGARAFETMRFDRAQEIAKHAMNFQKFQRRVEEVCGENGIKNSAARFSDLTIAA